MNYRIPTTASVLECLVSRRWRRNFCLPNYTPRLWWECDLFEVTKADCFIEYEIKTARNDFFQDARKGRRGRFRYDEKSDQWTGGLLAMKHELLAAGDKRGPQRFWYVVPDGLVEIDEIPEWAGYIKILWEKDRLREKIMKRAPTLHTAKITDGVADHARSVCYYRFHDVGRRFRQAVANAEWFRSEMKRFQSELAYSEIMREEAEKKFA